VDIVFRHRTSVCLILFSCGAAGCSSGGGATRAPVVEAGARAGDVDAMAGDADVGDAESAEADSGAVATVSFAQDVMPIFRRSCSTGSAMCHGDPGVTTTGKGTGGNRAYLGPPYSAGDPATILAGLVGQPSFEDPSMNVVSPGSPTTSYLMLKMDGALSPLAPACASGALGQCGAPMPMGGQLLPQATRDMVRSWIAQGALND
jgi:hypothetical protein